ncbi:S41 family peptidase [Novosphingobium album (ex Hu et al. 2023)]|uniref:S41 family peptidase n=1 Tax=Novosphingobium album (ex Hu et al. 2023) TaxID=2930093 RepID=A0ABT0B5U6_9SPHN|nr:S41 family peptidase [Novosphingobium album (ex Hu et al. 2023)]MCJ2180416.1 S41 family peptidase [Novosphingobium album (ex Hu et al. 2023)]
MRKIMQNAISPLSIIAALAAGTAFVATAARAAESGSACTTPAEDSADAAACKLAGMLERMFIYPETGARYAAVLREGVAQGRYVGPDREAAARAMTRDLQATSPDGHLRVFVPKEQPPAPAAQPRPDPAPDFPIIEQPGWIAPGIAYIRFNEFPYDPAVTQQANDFMAQHATARALIFDIRTHHGGGVEQMDAILPWLFAKPTRLLTMETSQATEDEFGSPVAGLASMRVIPDKTMARREHWVTPNDRTALRGAKVYLLTGPRTASAAEHFALAMKATHRATLVGEPTAGANHFGGQVDLPGGLVAFLPVGRTYDPATGKDWEGDGVAPDVAVPKEHALEWVLKDLGIDAAKARALSATHAPTLPMERRKRS